MELYVDKLLIFDINGLMAHFRKFYTNSSSLSYTFPPRTVITGLIAGMLGRERDKYYEELSCKKCKIAISVRTPVRKIMQTINYVRTKSLGELNLSAGHTQIPLEIILPLKDSGMLKYRIYFYHTDDIFWEFKCVLEKNKFIYPPYLGISEFIAEIKFIDFIKQNNIKKLTSSLPIEIVSVVNISQVAKGGLIFEPNSGETLQYIKERMPLEFDSNRKLKKGTSFIYEKNLNKAKLKIKDNYYRIDYCDPVKGRVVENIVFMEA